MRHRALLSTISAIAFIAGTGASLAADIPRAAPMQYTERTTVVTAYNWTGFYAGINGGYGWGGSNWGALGSSDPDGWLIGATLGYNWQAPGSPLVFGLEGDIAWANIRGGFANANCPTGCETRNNWLGTVRGRVGYSFDRVMPYVTGGVAFGDVEATRGGLASTSDTKAGWTLGGGIEAAVAPAWTAKLEYLYVDLGSVTNLGSSVDYDAHVLRAGLNFRF
jgi:outer membrane immunogenic protein